MLRRNKAAPADWSLQALVDLGAAIQTIEESGQLPDQQQVFRRHIAPLLEAETDSVSKRSQGLHHWLRYFHQHHDVARHRVASVERLLTLCLVALMSMLGWGLVRQHLGQHHTLHVPVFLLFTLLLPYGLLALTLMRELLPRLLSERPLALRLLLFTDRVFERVVGDQGGLLTRSMEDPETRQALCRTALWRLQMGAVAFYIALVLALVYYSTFYDIRFYWETTYQGSLTAFWSQLMAWLATPWSNLLPAAVPGYDLIASSRGLQEGLPTYGDSIWSNFLVMTLLVWGLVPRLLLLFYYRYRLRLQLRHLHFDGRALSRFWHQLSFVDARVVTPGTEDIAVVFATADVTIAWEALRVFLLNRLRLRPGHNEWLYLDQLDDSQWQAIAQMPLTGVVVIAESWDLAPKRLRRQLALLRQHLGDAIAITWLLYARPSAGQQMITPVDLREWKKAVAAIHDPLLEVRAYDA